MMFIGTEVEISKVSICKTLHSGQPGSNQQLALLKNRFPFSHCQWNCCTYEVVLMPCRAYNSNISAMITVSVLILIF